jgi:hypothetical protein
MKIAVVGRGNIGGGLADLWEGAGHDVRRIGRDGGDVSDAEAVLVAVPGAEIAAAVDNVQGTEGKTVIDATNLVGAEPPDGFSSNAEYVKSRTNGPTAKSFNLNFARVYDQIVNASSPPPCAMGTPAADLAADGRRAHPARRASSAARADRCPTPRLGRAGCQAPRTSPTGGHHGRRPSGGRRGGAGDRPAPGLTGPAPGRDHVATVT